MRSSRILPRRAGTLVPALAAIPPTLAYHYLGNAGLILAGGLILTLFATALCLAPPRPYARVLVRDDDGTVYEIDPTRSSLTEVTR